MAKQHEQNHRPQKVDEGIDVVAVVAVRSTVSHVGEQSMPCAIANPATGVR